MNRFQYFPTSLRNAIEECNIMQFRKHYSGIPNIETVISSHLESDIPDNLAFFNHLLSYISSDDDYDSSELLFATALYYPRPRYVEHVIERYPRRELYSDNVWVSIICTKPGVSPDDFARCIELVDDFVPLNSAILWKYFWLSKIYANEICYLKEKTEENVFDDDTINFFVYHIVDTVIEKSDIFRRNVAWLQKFGYRFEGNRMFLLRILMNISFCERRLSNSVSVMANNIRYLSRLGALHPCLPENVAIIARIQGHNDFLGDRIGRVNFFKDIFKRAYRDDTDEIESFFERVTAAVAEYIEEEDNNDDDDDDDDERYNHDDLGLRSGTYLQFEDVFAEKTPAPPDTCNFETQCAVCFDYPTHFLQTPCGHILCWSCFTQYQKKHDPEEFPCPLCRMIIRTERIPNKNWQVCAPPVVGGGLLTTTVGNFQVQLPCCSELLNRKEYVSLPKIQQGAEEGWKCPFCDKVLKFTHSMLKGSIAKRRALMMRIPLLGLFT